MKNKILWVLSVVPFIITLISIQFLPDTVPMHYDYSGEIDRWGSKYEQFIFPILILLLSAGWQAAISGLNKKYKKQGDEKQKKDTQNNINVIQWTALLMASAFLIMQVYFLYAAYMNAYNRKPMIEIETFISGVIGGLLLLIAVLIVLLYSYKTYKKDGAL